MRRTAGSLLVGLSIVLVAAVLLCIVAGAHVLIGPAFALLVRA